MKHSNILFNIKSRDLQIFADVYQVLSLAGKLEQNPRSTASKNFLINIKMCLFVIWLALESIDYLMRELEDPFDFMYNIIWETTFD